MKRSLNWTITRPKPQKPPFPKVLSTDYHTLRAAGEGFSFMLGLFSPRFSGGPKDAQAAYELGRGALCFGFLAYTQPPDENTQ
jgi:hypothetical protein